MKKLDKVEQLAVLQALQNRIGDMVKTKDPDNLRGQVDRMMVERYESDPLAGKSYDVKLFGEKVGTYSLTVSKAKPQSKRLDIDILDPVEFRQWCADMGFLEVNMKAVDDYVKATGNVPEGCEPITVIEPEIFGGEVTRTTLKVEPEKVAHVLGHELGEFTVGLLEGGIDD